jgi:hypothetical protein
MNTLHGGIVIELTIYQRCHSKQDLNLVLTGGGMDMHRLRIVPQGVDTDFFDPGAHRPMKLPIGERVWGRAASSAKQFVFLSVSAAAYSFIPALAIYHSLLTPPLLRPSSVEIDL